MRAIKQMKWTLSWGYTMGELAMKKDKMIAVIFPT